MHKLEISPRDQYNEELLQNVHPPDRPDPTPTGRYNMVVIGAGTGGLVSAAGTGALGGKAALIERNLMGGDCLNVGCVPSKTIIRSAHIMADALNSLEYGIYVPDGVQADFATVMERMRRVRATISHVDSVARYEKEFGVDIYLGDATFTGPDTVAVNGKTLQFKKAVIATGARAVEPAIPGLPEAGYLTNETVFNLTEQPKRLAVIGGGPIGSELAQAFRRLGSEVTLFHNADHILNREDADAADIVQRRFLRDGLKLVLQAQVSRVRIADDGSKVLHYTCPAEGEGQVAVDAILVGAGRKPNVDGLGLEAAGVEYDARTGVQVNDMLQTSNPNIYAVGDVALGLKFTHTADAAARIVIRNALFFGKQKFSDLVVPWVTYTDPEIAHVGMSAHEAEATGIAVETVTVQMEHNDRALADGDEEGFVKVHLKKGTDTIVGATIVARNAGDMISEFTVGMVNGLGLSKYVDVIHPYPTQAEAIRKVAEAHRRTRLTPRVKWVFQQVLRWQR